MPTIFSKIIAGEIPSYKVYEDENFFAFLDIHPRAKGHVLLVPKKEYRWVWDVTNFGEYTEVAKKIALAQIKAFSPLTISMYTYGMDVDHAHIHLIPLYSEHQGLHEEHNFSSEEMQQIADSIKNALQ